MGLWGMSPPPSGLLTFPIKSLFFAPKPCLLIYQSFWVSSTSLNLVIFSPLNSVMLHWNPHFLMPTCVYYLTLWRMSYLSIVIPLVFYLKSYHCLILSFFFFFLSLNIIELYNQKEHLDAVTSSSCFISVAYIQFGP